MFKKIVVALIVYSFLLTPLSFSQENPEQNYVPCEVFIKFQDGVSGETIQNFLDSWDLTVKRRFKIIKSILVKLPPGWAVEEAIEVLGNDHDVVYVEPNYTGKIQATTPNDTDYGELWGLDNTAQEVNKTTGTVDADIAATKAWDTEDGTTNSIIVAVIDTGINYNHTDLDGNIWSNVGDPVNGADDDGNGYTDDIRGWDFVDSDNDPVDEHASYHGTHVAGIIGAEGNNATGVVGVTWQCKLMPLRAANAAGVLTNANIISAIDYAITKGAKVINASFSTSAQSTLKEAIESARDSGILFVAAAGNDSAALADNPARYTTEINNVIAVAATDQNDDLWSDSGGTQQGSNYSTSSVDVAAPGVNIYSTQSSGPDTYGFLSGTSMSTAFVSGLAALLWAELGAATPYQDIKSQILNGVDVKTSLDGKVATEGRINANTSLDKDRDLPSPPSGLTASATSTSQINLTWVDESDNETGFIIERKTESGGTYAQVDDLDQIAEAESASDTGLSETTTYYYKIKATNATGDSIWTAEASAKTLSSSSSTSSASSAGSSGSSFEWSDLEPSCFIATAAFGSPMEKHVTILKHFRDCYLMTNKMGRAFVLFYYEHSPELAEYVSRHESLRAVVRLSLYPLVAISFVMLNTTPLQQMMILFTLVAAGLAGFGFVRCRGRDKCLRGG